MTHVTQFTEKITIYLLQTHFQSLHLEINKPFAYYQKSADVKSDRVCSSRATSDHSTHYYVCSGGCSTELSFVHYFIPFHTVFFTVYR